MAFSRIRQWRSDFETEGKKPFRKLGVTVSVSATTAAFIGSLGAWFRRDIKSLGNIVLTFTAVSATFTTSVLILTDVRKKDDPWNYFLASNISIAVLYSITGSQLPLMHGLWVFFPLAAAVYKYALLRGYEPMDYSRLVHSRDLISCFDFEDSPDVRHLNRK